MFYMLNPLRSGLYFDPASGGLIEFWGLQSVGPRNHWPPDKACVVAVHRQCYVREVERGRWYWLSLLPSLVRALDTHPVINTLCRNQRPIFKTKH